MLKHHLHFFFRIFLKGIPAVGAFTGSGEYVLLKTLIWESEGRKFDDL